MNFTSVEKLKTFEPVEQVLSQPLGHAAYVDMGKQVQKREHRTGAEWFKKKNSQKMTQICDGLYKISVI